MPSTNPGVCPHPRTDANEAAGMISTLLRAGYGYHHIADLTHLRLTHGQAREIATTPNLIRKAGRLSSFVYEIPEEARRD